MCTMFQETILKETNLLKKEVTCPICLDLFTEPITLTTCQHTFCLECFKRLSSDKTVPNLCPVCKKITNRRSYYVNEHFIETIKLLQMYDKLFKSLDEGSDKDDVYDRVNRMEKFLNDCVTFQNQDVEECLSLSSSSDVSNSVLYNTLDDFKPKIQGKNNSLDDFKPKIQGKNNSLAISKPKRQPSKTPIKKTKSLNCTIVKGKYPQKRQKKSTEYVDTIKIDEYDSINDCELVEEDKKIVKLIEEDFLQYIENEVQNTKNKEENQNEQVVNKKEEKIKQKHKRKHESCLKQKSGESNSSKKTDTSTGWSRMKTMKKQINKKEFKYKQLNVSSEINKSKSKSPQDKISNLIDLAKKSKPIVQLSRVDLSSDDNVNKSEITKVADMSLHIKSENISPDKFDLLVQGMEEDKTVHHDQEDLYAKCTQKLQSPIINEQPQNVSDADNISKFIADAQVHRCSTPVKILPEKEQIIVDRHSSKRVKENICVIEETTKSAESFKVTKRKRNVGKTKEKNFNEESDDVISATERTPESKKESSSLRRRSLRSASKRNSNENTQTESKTSPKRRRITRRHSKEKTVDPENQNAVQEQSKSKVALNEEQNNDKIVSEDKKSTKIGNEDNTEQQNLKKKSDLIKNELKSCSEKEATVISALQTSLNAINVVLSQCSSYVNSESLFSQSCLSKDSKKSNINSINIDINNKSRLLDGYHSLPLQSNSQTPVHFYETVIPCLKKIEEFYNEIISLSHELTNETESFTNIFSNSKECKNATVSFRSKTSENVETQTDNITCPKCSCIIDFNSKDKTKSFENTTLVGFKELNDIDNISKHFSEGNDSQKNIPNSNNTKQANSDSADIISINTSEKSRFKELNDIDNISKHFSEENDSQKIRPNSNNTKQANSNSADIISINASEKSSESVVLKTKKVNRQLTYSEESSNTQRRKFKRIRSPTPDSDSESVKSKKSNRNYSKLLYKDIDIFFESDPSEKNHDLSLGSQTSDKYPKKLCSETINSMNKKNNSTSNPEDTPSKYISFLEREYKNVQFDISKDKQPVEKQNFDSAPNTVLDNLLRSINVSDFESDHFESDNNKKSPLTHPPESENKNNAVEKKTENSVTEALSASMFLTEREIHKLSDVDKTKSIEKVLETVNLSARNAEDKELDKEVENLTSDDIVVVEDSLGSDKDIFGEDNIVESTPQKTTENKTERGNYEFAEELPVPILEIIEPPATVTENLEWFDIAPPPPPEFQDSEKIEVPKSVILNVSSVTPDIFALNHLDKGFFANSTFLTGNTTKQTIKESSQRNTRKESSEFDIIPNSSTQEKEVFTNQENNKTIVPSNPESKIWQPVKRNLNPIVLAQKEKYSPLQIILSQNPSPKPVISSTPKHQKSILSYVQTVSTPQKENDVNEINKNLLRSTPAKQNVDNKSNTFVPIKENEEIEICESPVPQNNNPSSSYMEKNKFLNESNTKNNSVSEKSKHKACIACSRLKRDEIVAILTLTQKLGAKYTRDFDKNVTHLVVSVDDRNRIQDHTIKYVLAIAHSVWIVSSAWIRDSLQHNQLLPEEPYEVLDVCGIPGPKISRLTRLSNPLFKNYMICCVDPFGSVNRTDIENAIISLGGEIIKSLDDLTSREGKYCLIVVEAKETQNFDQYQVWRDKYNVLVVDVEWLSRTIGQYQITSVRPYMLCLETDINELGYPFALIAPVPETSSQMTMTNTNH